MTTLTEFLLERIAEDEALAREVEADNLHLGAISTGDDPWPSERAFAEHVTPVRVLAECEARRRIVEDFHHLDAMRPDVLRAHAEWTCRTLALPHADHPDYREEWRP